MYKVWITYKPSGLMQELSAPDQASAEIVLDTLRAAGESSFSGYARMEYQKCTA